jgi:hypothetical protein
MRDDSQEPKRPAPSQPPERLRETEAALYWDTVYHGRRLPDGRCEVWAQDITVHTFGDITLCRFWRRAPEEIPEISNGPLEFNWGIGKGVNLAYWLVLDAWGEKDTADRSNWVFCCGVVMHWGDSWTISGKEIRDFVRQNRDR